MSQSLQVRPSARNLIPAIAFATVLVLSATSVGVLVAARHLGKTTGTAASGARAEVSPALNPSPITDVATVQLSAPSTNVVWALVNYDHLYRSTDQANHWEQRAVPPDSGVRPMVSFVDDHEGWLLAPGSPTTQCQEAAAGVWHTTDAGASWQQLQATGIAVKQCKDGIWFVDAKNGFVSASDPNNRPTVYRTSDGGRSWAATTLQDPAYFRSQPGGFTLQVGWIKRFGSTLYLEASGRQDDPSVPHDNQFVLKSTDGGASWSLVTKIGTRRVVMVTELRWLDLLIPEQSMESVNGGQQFHRYASDFKSAAGENATFVFADAQVGYAPARDVLQRTLDGGMHWTRLPTPGIATRATPSLVSQSPIPMPSSAVLSAPNANVVWALVANQYLFRSTDQGRTWQQRVWGPPYSGGGNPLISFVDETNGWALFLGVPGTQCAQQGAQLWRTTDGSTTWKLVSVVQYGQVSPQGFAFEQCKEAMYFADSTHGFVGAADPTGESIYRTLDGGITWSASSLPIPPGWTPGGGRLTITSIKAFGSTVLAYASPYVFESTDRGATWAYLASMQDGLINVAFVTPSRWLMLRNDRAGSETTDSGQTWHAFASDYADAAGVSSDFVFADASVGYGTVRGGVQRTVDGGAHWELIKGTWP